MDPAPLDDAALDSLELMFPEPERPKSPPPTVQRYERDIPPGSGQSRGNRTLEIRLVGQHPLWGHHLYSSALGTEWQRSLTVSPDGTLERRSLPI